MKLSNDSEISIYPNPTTGFITVEFDEPMGASEITVVNTLNKIVYTRSLTTTAQKKINIDLSGEAKGIYFIKLKTETKEERRKVILK
ncbi:MAG: T9SS type A sorting domain-containing protein [Bacteroidales bacterium]